jgi:hypothetical protein
MLKKILIGSIMVAVILFSTAGVLYADQKDKTSPITKSETTLTSNSEANCIDKNYDCKEGMDNGMMSGGMMNDNTMGKTMMSGFTSFKDIHGHNHGINKNGNQNISNYENGQNCDNMNTSDGSNNCTMMGEGNQTCSMMGN